MKCLNLAIGETGEWEGVTYKAEKGDGCDGCDLYGQRACSYANCDGIHYKNLNKALGSKVIWQEETIIKTKETKMSNILETPWKFQQPELMEVWDCPKPKAPIKAYVFATNGDLAMTIHEEWVDEANQGEGFSHRTWDHHAPIKTPTLRPYRHPELIEAVKTKGFGVIGKTSEIVYQIQSIGEVININGFRYDYKDLLINYTHLDGTPMGVEE